MTAKSGRPLKYARLLEKLDPLTLYTPSTIAEFACTIGFIRDKDPEQLRYKRQRIRTSCSRLIHEYEFPVQGDELISIKGQHVQPAWYGRRWLDILDKKQKQKSRKKVSRKRGLHETPKEEEHPKEEGTPEI